MKIGLIGNGYWGKVYLKTLSKMPEVESVTVATHDYKSLLDKSFIDCVIIATPLKTHFEIAKDCLLEGKHVLLEKPFTSNSKEASKLLELINHENGRLVLLAGHVYLHHNGIVELKRIIDNGELGEIQSIYSKRMSLNEKYPDALWEMGVHDIYIFDYLFDGYGQKVKKASGNNMHCIFNIEYSNKENVINTYIKNCSKLPNKVREITIIGTEKYVIFDDEANADVKIKIIDRKSSEEKFIKVDLLPTPLEKQCQHFFDCIKNDKIVPIANAFDGYKNIRMLEEIDKLLKKWKN